MSNNCRAKPHKRQQHAHENTYLHTHERVQTSRYKKCIYTIVGHNAATTTAAATAATAADA